MLTLLARLTHVLQGALFGQVGRCPRSFLTMLTRLAGILFLALWAPFGTLSPSDCYPSGPCVAGGPVGPDGTLSPFILNHAGPAGRHVATRPVGPFGMLSPSDCHPAGPAGPYVAGALLAQMGHCLHLSLTMLARLPGMFFWPCGPVWGNVPI